jgi:DNA-binding MarR family transcriptional regulator
MGQSRALLSLLGEETLWLIVRSLLRRTQSQEDLIGSTGLEQSQVSRALRRLRDAGLVQTGRGNGTKHSIDLRNEVLSVIRTGDQLAEAINAERTEAQRRASRQTVEDQLRGADAGNRPGQARESG